MILVATKDLRNPEKLRERMAYLQELLDEGFPNVSPSSQEWTSPEFQAGHNRILRDEIDEIITQLRVLDAKRLMK